MTKAKTGDLIRIIALGSSVHVDTLKIGSIYEVIAVKDGKISVDVLGGYVVFEDEYEIYRKQSNAAQVGDLIRITTVRDEITAYKLGGIYEVTSLEASNYDQIVINGEHGQSGYVFADEYVVHRKVGEESAEQRCNNCGKEGVHTCRGAEYHAEQSEQDVVNSPQHYNAGKFETIEVIEEITSGYSDGFLAYCIGNTLKYVARAPFKHGEPTEDLRKAAKYLEFAIEHLDAKSTQD